MSAHNVYHIVPRDGGWASRLQGASTVSVQGDDRDEVQAETELVLRQLGTGRIVFHREDGTIESVHTFDQIVAEREPTWVDTLATAPVLIGVAAACLVGLGFVLRGRD